MKFNSTLLGALLSLSPLFAQATVIDFDDPDIFTEGLSDFYADEGVTFAVPEWAVIAGLPGAGPTSPPGFATPQYGTGWMNVLGGFTDLFSFTYGTRSNDNTATVNIFDGLYGTGTLLASITLPSQFASTFAPASISFSGTAYSVAVVAGPLSFGWDDLQFSNRQQAVPVPATLPLVGIGLAGLGWSKRKKV